MLNQKNFNNYIGGCNDKVLKQISKQFGINDEDINDISHSKKSLLYTISQSKPKTY